MSLKERIKRLEMMPEARRAAIKIAHEGESQEQAFERYFSENPELKNPSCIFYLNFYSRGQNEPEITT